MQWSPTSQQRMAARLRLRLDDADHQIMELLQADGRCSYRRLMQETGLGETTVRQRVARMLRLGIFTITIVRDPLAMGRVVALARLRVTQRAASEVAVDVAALGEVECVSLTTGTHPVAATLVCDDHEALTYLVDTLRCVDGVLDLEVSLMLSGGRQRDGRVPEAAGWQDS